MKISLNIKKLVGVSIFAIVIAVSSFGFSMTAKAETNTASQLELKKTLLKQIELLQAQLSQMQGSGGSSVSQCVQLSRSMYLGSKDSGTAGEVSKLQQFLTSTGHYSYGEVTGYYGPATQRAVQAWQASEGIVSFGGPDTTGYGVVGPSTRGKMSRCEYVPLVKIPAVEEPKKEAHEPAYLSMSFDTEDPINVLRFNVEFQTDDGEGLLKVYFDGDLVHTIDQRFARKYSEEEVYIGVKSGTLKPGRHSLAIRLDGFGDEEAGVEITDVTIGLLTYELDKNDDDKDIITKRDFKEIVTTGPGDGYHTKRGSLFEWSWGWNGTISPTVDIYIEGGKSLFEVATKYPNNGRYSWAADTKSSDWERRASNGDYTMIICPSGKDTDSDYCGSFEFILYDEDMPEINGDRDDTEISWNTGSTEKSSKREIISSYPSDGYKAKRGTKFQWGWSWTSSKSEKVDIYIEGKDTIWEMATDYPNNGSFWWNAGSKGFGWSKSIPNGDYKMRVCPAGKDIDSGYCDGFTFSLHGATPEVVLVSPQKYDLFKPGTTMEVTIGSMIKGDLYEIQLKTPAMVSGIDAIKEEFYAASDGINTYKIEIPPSLEDGNYNLDVLQKTVEGVKCVNAACATENTIIQLIKH